MPLALAEADAARLTRSPLEVVVAQIRYETSPDVGEGRVALAVHEALGGASGPYPNLDQSQTVSITFGPGQVPQAEQGTAATWRFASKDGGWTVSLTPDFVALETTRYTTWEGDFRVRLGAVIDAIADHVAPVFNPRIGIRYVDRIAELALSSPTEWEPFVAAELLGPVLHPVLGPGVRQAQQQILLELDESTSCNLRHGFLPEGDRLDYLMDFDVFRQGARGFDRDDIKNTADILNNYALRLFHTCATSTLLKALR